MKKKMLIVSSITLASLLLVGQFVYAEKANNMMNMMNGNGMKKMMETMNSSEGQKMLKPCEDVMNSTNNGDEK